MFTAKGVETGPTFYKAGTYLTFPNVMHNIGNGLNGATGTFSASVSGYYEFTFTCYSTWEVQSHHIEIQKNGRNEFHAQVRTSASRVDISNGFGTTFQLMLKTSDTVKLYVSEGQLYSGPNEVTMFTGKYLRPLTSG